MSLKENSSSALLQTRVLLQRSTSYRKGFRIAIHTTTAQLASMNVFAPGSKANSFIIREESTSRSTGSPFNSIRKKFYIWAQNAENQTIIL